MPRYVEATRAAGYVVTEADWNDLNAMVESIEPYSLFTAPPTTGWSWVNQGTASVSQDATWSDITMSLVGTSGDNHRLYLRTPAATSNYTWTVFLEPSLLDQEHQWTGMILRDSAGGGLIVFGHARTEAQTQLNVTKWTSATSFNSNYKRTSVSLLHGSPRWLRIRDNGTGRFFEYSFNGTDWMEIYSVGRTDFITPDQFGIGGMNQVLGYTSFLRLRSWAEA